MTEGVGLKVGAVGFRGNRTLHLNSHTLKKNPGRIRRTLAPGNKNKTGMVYIGILHFHKLKRAQ